LQDFAYEEFASAERARLEELRLNAVEDRIQADLQRGLSHELVGELEALRRTSPFRERLIRQLMLSLHRAGRQAEALRAFDTFSRDLTEVGLEPSPELRRLQEQVLLHDAELHAPRVPSGRPSRAVPVVTNPYKGLYAFAEADAADFFGRERLVADVVMRLARGGRLVTLVGPSGSGKSSLLRAGLIPALRDGAVPGSDRWVIASMAPSARPFADLEAALLSVAPSPVEGPSKLDGVEREDLLVAASRSLSDDRAELVLVVDQLEELFASSDERSTSHPFLSSLLLAVDDPSRRVRVIVALRADAYHRPLAHPEFGGRLDESVVNVLPLTIDELEAAAQGPLARVGLAIEPRLLAELLRDVFGEPGSLPIFQYTLRELFDRRRGAMLTIDAYRSIGGVRGALRRRADNVYASLRAVEQDAARQLFLRLVTITRDDVWSRRRVRAAEIVALDVDVVVMEAVIAELCSQRFLAVDRDPLSGDPTLEVAHEALLRQWPTLRHWIANNQEDIRRHEVLRRASEEWVGAGHDPAYLLTGSRLAECERWQETTSMALTTFERAYLEAGLEQRRSSDEREAHRQAQERLLRRRAKRRLWVLIAIALVGSTIGIYLAIAREAPLKRVVLVYGGRNARGISALMANGLDGAHRDLQFASEEIVPPMSDVEGQLRRVAATHPGLIIIGDALYSPAAIAVQREYPEVSWLYLDRTAEGSAAAVFAEHEGTFLAGAAAALTSRTGTIGFVGGYQLYTVERFRAGFEAGAYAVRPDVKVLATYASLGADGFIREDLARAAADRLYTRGADVVLQAAGAAGAGVFEAARAATERQSAQNWAIGVDSDQYLEAEPRLRPYILASMVKKYDVAIELLVKDFLQGDLKPTTSVLALADGAVGLATTGDQLDANVLEAVGALERDIIAGQRAVPVAPTGNLDPPSGVTDTVTARVTFDGTTCGYMGPTSFRPSDVVRVEFRNHAAMDALADIYDTTSSLLVVSVPAPSGGDNSGYALLEGGHRYQLKCESAFPSGTASVAGEAFSA
jgi:basic membrane lipoprotein Med (substrate-binding protein (PBP1-ABC) superfamily)